MLPRGVPAAPQPFPAPDAQDKPRPLPSTGVTPLARRYAVAVGAPRKLASLPRPDMRDFAFAHENYSIYYDGINVIRQKQYPMCRFSHFRESFPQVHGLTAACGFIARLNHSETSSFAHAGCRTRYPFVDVIRERLQFQGVVR